MRGKGLESCGDVSDVVVLIDLQTQAVGIIVEEVDPGEGKEKGREGGWREVGREGGREERETEKKTLIYIERTITI